MSEETKFNPDLHKEVGGDFVPKGAEEDVVVAQEMAEAGKEHEDTRVKKGIPPYSTGRHRAAGSFDMVETRHRSKFRKASEDAAERVKLEMGLNNNAILKMTTKAKENWSIDFDSRVLDVTNLADELPQLSREQRVQVIESLEVSAMLKSKEKYEELAKDRKQRIENYNKSIKGTSTENITDGIDPDVLDVFNEESSRGGSAQPTTAEKDYQGDTIDFHHGRNN